MTFDPNGITDIVEITAYGLLLPCLLLTLWTVKVASKGALRIDHTATGRILGVIASYLSALSVFCVLRLVSSSAFLILNTMDPDEAGFPPPTSRSSPPPGRVVALVCVGYIAHGLAASVFWGTKATILAAWVSTLCHSARSRACYVAAFSMSILYTLLQVAQTIMLCLLRATTVGRIDTHPLLSIQQVNVLSIASVTWDVVTAVGCSIIVVTTLALARLYKRSIGLMCAVSCLSWASWVIRAALVVACRGPCQHDATNLASEWTNSHPALVHIFITLSEVPLLLLGILGLRRLWLNHYQHYAITDFATGLELLAHYPASQ